MIDPEAMPSKGVQGSFTKFRMRTYHMHNTEVGFQNRNMLLRQIRGKLMRKYRVKKISEVG